MQRSLRLAFFAGAALILLSCRLSPAWADRSVTLYDPAVLPGETAAQCYGDAVGNLNHGTWFDRCALQLKEAVRQDPKNPAYHLALGCAYADRAASIAYAAGYAQMHKGDSDQYPKDLADWQKAQSDPTSNLYHTDPPVPPPAFRAYTKDDLAWFTLSEDQARARIKDLSDEAQSEWKMAISLENTAAGRANDEYVQGWGLDLLSLVSRVFEVYNDQAAPDTTTAQSDSISGLPTAKDAAKSFAAAVQDEPGVAVYWQSLGDALARGNAWEIKLNDSSNAPAAVKGMTAMDAYRRSLALDPKNALLFWYIAEFEVRSDPAAAVSDLKRMIAADSTNAYPMYILADSELAQTHYTNNSLEDSSVDQNDFAAAVKVDSDMAATLTDQDRSLAQDAIRYVELGNDAPYCGYPIYHPPVLKMLAPAFDELARSDILFPTFADQRALARDLCGYADVAALNGDLSTAVDVDQDIVAMGKKTIGDWSMQEDWQSGHILLGELVGLAIANIGYKDMERNAEHYGDPGMAEAAEEEFDAFHAQGNSWRQTLRDSNTAENNIYSEY